MKNALPRPVVYCFYMGVLSLFGLVFAFFGPVSFETKDIIAGVLVGGFFMLPLYIMYKAVFLNEASRVGPAIGALTPIFVSLFSYFFLGERLYKNEVFAFIILVLGGILIFFEFNGNDWKNAKFQAYRILRVSALAAFLFGIYFVLLKLVYTHDNFISGFVWTRLGSFLTAFLFLIPRSNRQLIFGETKILKPKLGILVAANKTISGIAFALLNYAIALGSVTLVNAMQGLQYVFLLILVVVLSHKYPQILSEAVSKKTLAQKIIAVVLIGLGLAIMAI